jgi:hypothetical protein
VGVRVGGWGGLGWRQEQCSVARVCSVLWKVWCRAGPRPSRRSACNPLSNLLPTVCEPCCCRARVAVGEALKLAQTAREQGLDEE